MCKTAYHGYHHAEINIYVWGGTGGGLVQPGGGGVSQPTQPGGGGGVSPAVRGGLSVHRGSGVSVSRLSQGGRGGGSVQPGGEFSLSRLQIRGGVLTIYRTILNEYSRYTAGSMPHVFTQEDFHMFTLNIYFRMLCMPLKLA